MTAVPVVGWPDRYRPTALEEMALGPDDRQRFEWFLSHGLPRHLVLSGPPGFGKTTIATLIVDRRYRGRTMRVKAAETGNVEFIRTRVLEFMRGMGFGDGKKLVIFEEATGLSSEAMEALRDPMEGWRDLCDVIFITNDLEKLDAALKSRCDVVTMVRPPHDECARVLGRIIEAEGTAVDPGVIRAFVRGHFAGGSDDSPRDLRTLLSEAQRYVETTGTLPTPPDPQPGTLLEVWNGEWNPENTPEGAQLLSNLADQFNRFLVLPTGGVEVLALWTVFAWAHEAFGISPILALVSPTKGAGKTTVLEMLYQLLRFPEGRTLHTSNITPASLYRLKGLSPADQAHASLIPKRPDLCLLLDEADTWLHHHVKGIINSGWKRSGANVTRSGAEGGTYSTWYPKALALIDKPDSPLPLTLRDRSIIVPMQRKRKDEERERLPTHHPLPELGNLCEAVQAWVVAHFNELRDLGGGGILGPAELKDRGPENWHQLVCVARVAGGNWEARAHQASIALGEGSRETELLVDLLRDIKAVFDTEDVEMIRSTALVMKLLESDDGPWRERRLTAYKLSRMLSPLSGIPKTAKGRQVWMGEKNLQGYRREWFTDAFTRYL